MVVERLLPLEFLKRSHWAGFVVGWSYCLISMVIALYTFPQDPALVTVGLTSILLLPSLGRFSALERSIESNEGSVNLRGIFRANKDFYMTYLAIFFGMFFVFAIFAILLPSLASSKLFETQLAILTGRAFNPGLFLQLLSNNIVVLLACFLLSLVAGNGSIFLITWNASVWGTIFGITAKSAATALQGNPFILFILVLISVFPHVFLEISSYIVGTISGAVISDSVIDDGVKSEKFFKVLGYNLVLFAIALALLVVGGLVEAYVIGNFKVYSTIIAFAR
ncbi:stage II sporulation protein M [Candidatus Woesearchaeota archaeon]|nr:stage II sporulation protein M [Candidatus Woesearchaeota archaeon]